MPKGGQDIVYDIGGDSSRLVAAGDTGAKSLRQMDAAAKGLGKQVERLSSPMQQFQRSVNAAFGVADGVISSAQKSAKAFEAAWSKSTSQVNRLRAELDPLYSASMRYQSALEQLDSAVKREIITEEERLRLLGLAEKAYLSTGTAATTSASKMGGFAGIVGNNRAAIQMFGLQMQDVAVQLAAGTRATTVFAQQGSQMLGVFGAYGALAGAALAITLPLAGAFFSAADGAKSLDDAMSNLEKAVRLVDDAARNYTAQGLQQMLDKYGKIDGAILALIERQRKLAVDKANFEAAASVQALADKWDVLNINLSATGPAQAAAKTQVKHLADELGVAYSEAEVLVRHLQNAANATSFAEKAKELGVVADVLQKSSLKSDDLTKSVIDSADAMLQLAHSVPEANWLNAAISGAETLWQKLHDAVVEKARLAAADSTDIAGNSTGFGLDSAARHAPPGRPMDLGVPDTKTGKGGGAGNNPAEDLKRLQGSLMTPAEQEQQSYQDSLKVLDQYLASKHGKWADYSATLEALQKQHQEKMAQLDVWHYGSGLDKAQSFFGDMADAMQSGNERMQRIGRIFGAAEALVNAWRAYTQTMADPTLPFWAKIPAAMSVLAAGMNAVNAIKGGSGSSSSHASSARSSAATAGSTAAASPANVNIAWYGGMTAASMGSLTSQLNAEYKQGYRLNLGIGAL